MRRRESAGSLEGCQLVAEDVRRSELFGKDDELGVREGANGWLRPDGMPQPSHDNVSTIAVSTVTQSMICRVERPDTQCKHQHKWRAPLFASLRAMIVSSYASTSDSDRLACVTAEN